MDETTLRYVQAEAPVKAVKQVDEFSLVTLTRTFPVPAGAVWAALTQPDQLRTWSPCVPDHGLDVEGPATLQESDDADAVDGTVTEVEPERLLVHRWGTNLMIWRLEPENDGAATTLTVMQRVDAEAEDDLAYMCAAGWHICLATLAARLDGHDVPPAVGMVALEYGWSDLKEAYENASAS